MHICFPGELLTAEVKTEKGQRRGLHKLYIFTGWSVTQDILKTLYMLEKNLQQVTTLWSLVGRPGVEPAVGIVVTRCVCECVGLSERSNTLHTVAQLLTSCCIQVSSFGPL